MKGSLIFCWIVFLSFALKGELSYKKSKELNGTDMKTVNEKKYFYIDEIFKVMRFSLAMELNIEDVRAILWISLKSLPGRERELFIEDILRIYQELLQGTKAKTKIQYQRRNFEFEQT